MWACDSRRRNDEALILGFRSLSHCLERVEDTFVAARILDRLAYIALSTVAYSMYTKVVEPVYVASSPGRILRQQ